MNGLQANPPAQLTHASSDNLAPFAWGIFFIWTGAAFLTDLGWPVGVLGVGAIAVGVQAVRVVYLGLRVEVFGLAVGIAMLAWGAWHAFGPRFGLVRIPGGLLPIAFIALGVALVLRALLRRDAPREDA
ncbi:hypothetical protein ACPWT1_20445 [Ramlibacter sp. MMS24-I3-19]|uniref:hypothetical protein n=1 Tax=Ramlibacter sp. MMS24-I3-19 TaxID=3416606 RepID=UPI003D0333F5